MINKNLLKKISLISTSLLLVLSLASCGDKGETTSENISTVSSGSSKPIAGSVSYSDMMKKLDEAKKVNELAKAWLTVPGTNIDYPIIVDPDHDNNYWLAKNLKGEEIANPSKKSEDTVVYAHAYTKLEKEISAGSANIVLFGHNWLNIRDPLAIGNDPKYTMFEQLPSYTDIDFAKEHPYIYFSTPDNEMVWKVFSVMYSESDWDESVGVQYWQPNMNSTQKSAFYNEVIDRSLHIFDTDVNKDDTFLTLSTCTRIYPNAGENQKFVVVARLLRDGESDKDQVGVAMNTSVKEPNFS